MARSLTILVLVTFLFAAGCAVKVGRHFPSPDATMVAIGTTDKAFLRRVFGEPYQVGLDSGDQTWRWFYGEHGTSAEMTKDLTVRFNPNGTVKSYSFMSNFPQDMTKLK